MQLTKEQETIVNSSLKSFKINAVAGSGKTTTLLLYAQKNPELRILYLAYNKSLQISILDKLKEFQVPNLTTSTIHSFIYKRTRALNYNLTNELKTNVLDRLISYYEFDTNNNSYYASNEYLALLRDLVNFYCNSRLKELNLKLLENFIKQSDFIAKTLELLNKNEEKLLEHLKVVLKAMKTRQIDATHDFYLKMYYLSSAFNKSLDFDLILIDEAQDISDVMIAIVEEFKTNKIYVGDNFQQIYSFRYATNALAKIDLPSYNLTISFRFSDSYASFLQRYLNKAYSLNQSPNLKISGIDCETNIGLSNINSTKQVCIISRTSFALISHLIKYIQEKKKIYFEGGYSSYSFMNQTVYSIFYLKNRKNEKVTVEDLKPFSTIYELETFAKETKNQEYLNIIKFINTYGDNIFEINKKAKELVVSAKEEADVIFTTTHKAKGMEYEQVIMTDDFITIKDITNPKSNLSFLKIKEELNIFYVAATRVKSSIVLASLE
ncbi:UvrD-helicase domain-containing protein [Aliarcobacter thereius]|uniref:DNA helicase n=1 Tax=Aliarcobacter thereius TaxID=544718 RepID=A0A5R9H8X4_9BACT|nr:UvrD-helicase domain-containing protein [Aliarcobacter thereius]OCL94132.1 UvrD/REP helicase [Aliarcobacter thereius]TLS72954.1 DNA helicase [Aliarcobacter thereius]TLT08366.1 DNA helicase [Aliarcobacter thereius]